MLAEASDALAMIEESEKRPMNEQHPEELKEWQEIVRAKEELIEILGGTISDLEERKGQEQCFFN
ncbi:MAG: hypothetical protein MPW14_17505 [Candidatus Manganitrophus sp.]|nr:hypothetical protein [Candidatus Manganitrophus sp.]MDC4223176.1 hypothetical protein [Candidatus Manganitrophus sp.]WDT69469.1 MAG: hypothetical protein MPW17_11790 [Candidatus Manganitrophus sp.]WDT74310.1 MAG: hypothetical protein MPW16_13725 [Candidatus Manganitrophus sp.]WDT78944.1 MAG: hypothetical protein MPW14_17505 [Candidatus Manganitrophus sp.]